MKALNVNDRKVEDFREDGRYALKSGLGGIHRFVDGKPYCTGKEN